MVSWNTRMVSSSGYWVFSHPEICSGDQSNTNLPATLFRKLRLLARRNLFVVTPTPRPGYPHPGRDRPNGRHGT